LSSERVRFFPFADAYDNRQNRQGYAAKLAIFADSPQSVIQESLVDPPAAADLVKDFTIGKSLRHRKLLCKRL